MLKRNHKHRLIEFYEILRTFKPGKKHRYKMTGLYCRTGPIAGAYLGADSRAQRSSVNGPAGQPVHISNVMAGFTCKELRSSA